MKGIAEHSKELESVIRQQFAGAVTQVYPDYYGNDSFSAISGGHVYLVSVLQQDFSEITQAQHDAYRSFVSNCVNARWRLLIIGRKGHSAHSSFIRSILPVKIQGINYKQVDGFNVAGQIAKAVSNLLYKEDTEGFPSQAIWAGLRCINTHCPHCNEEVLMPSDIEFYNKQSDFESIGFLPIRNWTENMIANVRFQIPHLVNPKVARLILNKLPSPQFELVCFNCAEKIPLPPDKSQPAISFKQYIYLTYDDLCKIKPVCKRSNTL